jgi:ribosomal-protein-serine acetyltransferase
MNKVKIRFLELPDRTDLFNLIQSNKSRLIRYLPGTCKSNESLESSIDYIKESKEKSKRKENYVFGIFFSEKLVGITIIKSIDLRSLKCELGYFIDQDHEGKGIMSEAFKLTNNFCFEELKMQKLYLRTGEENDSSIRLAQKNGFQLEGILRNDFKTETGEWVNIAYYGRLR